MFSIKWEERALKDLDKLDLFIAKRIIKKVDTLQENPFAKDVKRLKGETTFRLRIGEYRVFFEIKDNIINIWKIGHRKNIY